jgi:hypothetical protein
MHSLADSVGLTSELIPFKIFSILFYSHKFSYHWLIVPSSRPHFSATKFCPPASNKSQLSISINEIQHLQLKQHY